MVVAAARLLALWVQVRPWLKALVTKLPKSLRIMVLSAIKDIHYMIKTSSVFIIHTWCAAA